MKNLLLLTFFIYGTALAGGETSGIDPLNGCFEQVGFNGDEQESQTRDFIVNRSKYRIMIDSERFIISTQCWQGRSKCIKMATICRKDGVEVYNGFTWLWR